MDPELKGSPILFTMKTSVFPKKAMVKGKSNLKMNNKIAITTAFAIMKFLTVTFS
ncbi:hypothetical protein D3C87_1437630 [compost metagenome]